jgi:cellulose synthase/poly-beta-1,6-N-acetylglucosamine synthase-like glycosyltransferase
LLQTVFWVLIAALVWAYAGYPIVMFVRARSRAAVPRAHDSPRPGTMVSVVMAVRNEGECIVPRLQNLLAQQYPPDLLEVLVVCNGCTDDTDIKARQFSTTDARVRVLASSEQDGKSGAINLGVAHANGDVIIFADARQHFEITTVANLVAGFADADVGAVTGRLEIAKSSRPAVAGVGKYWQMETTLRQAESSTGSVVGATGAVYGVRRSLFQPLPPNLILDDVLIPMQITLRGLRVVMKADAVAYDEPAPSQRAEFRRKVRTMVGNIQLIRVMPALLSPRRNPAFGRFVSHKLLRVMTPILTLGSVVTGLLIGGTLYVALALTIVGALSLGGIGLAFRGRALALPAAFLLVNAAALAALLRPRRSAADVWVR